MRAIRSLTALVLLVAAACSGGSSVRRRAVALSLVLAFITSACTGSGGEDSRVRAAREAERAIAGAEEQGAPATELAIDRLAVGSPDELRAAALAHIEDASPEVHSAALYALALSVNQDDRKAIDALRGFLDPGADDERLTAADGLLSIGEKAAIPVLIELLTSKAPVPDSDPPTAVWEVAKGLLLFHTDQDLGLGEAEVAGAAAAAQVDWEAWWEASAEDLTWDPDTWSFTS